ncbi:MAG TPA: TonB-dependent receptor plug domain-containing protein, partial [Ginsengibacter sp.]|nr:TonB-dependent receptor plug domain-containing protein [Ginsengibacter sp.]
MKKGWIIALAMVTAGSLRAQDSAQVLDEVVVTASKTPIKQSQTGKVLTVISKQTIEQNPGKTLSELLTQQAGVVINGGKSNLGTNPAIFLRGASSGNT